MNGLDGLNGADGADGLSAYEIWMAAGNTGNESDFLASLIGVDGAQGETGPEGPQGTEGPQGEAGADGADGAAGLSAYEIWLGLGNTGTEEDFIAYLSGGAAFSPSVHGVFDSQTDGNTFEIAEAIGTVSIELWGASGGSGGDICGQTQGASSCNLVRRHRRNRWPCLEGCEHGLQFGPRRRTLCSYRLSSRSRKR